MPCWHVNGPRITGAPKSTTIHVRERLNFRISIRIIEAPISIVCFDDLSCRNCRISVSNLTRQLLSMFRTDIIVNSRFRTSSFSGIFYAQTMFFLNFPISVEFQSFWTLKNLSVLQMDNVQKYRISCFSAFVLSLKLSVFKRIMSNSYSPDLLSNLRG